MSIPSAPSEPQILLKPRSSPQTLEFAWNPPISDGGAAITTYRLTVTPPVSGSPAAPPMIFSLGPTERYKLVSGLTNGVTYEAALEASNDNGSTWGSAAAFLPWQPGTQPQVGPAAVSLSSLGVSSAVVGWTPPSSAPDATIFWYVVTSVSNQPSDPVLRVTGDGLDQTSVVMDDLNPTSQYAFTVQAVTCAGYSPGTSTTTTVGPSTIAQEGLVAHFDAATYDGAGAWTDRSSNARVATVAAGSPAKTRGGNAVTFDGNLYYTFSNPGLQSDWSIQFWLKRRGTQGRPAVLTEQLTSQMNMYASFYSGAGAPSSTSIRAGWYDGAFVTGAAVPFPDETWTSMCVTWDNSTKKLNTYASHSNPTTMQLVQVDTYADVSPSSSGNPYFIGADWSLEGAGLVGDLGEVAIYGRALGSNEVFANFEAVRPKYL